MQGTNDVIGGKNTLSNIRLKYLKVIKHQKRYNKKGTTDVFKDGNAIRKIRPIYLKIIKQQKRHDWCVYRLKYNRQGKEILFRGGGMKQVRYT